MYGPPDYPRASSSPTIILLVSGMAAMLGFLLGFFTGLGSGDPSSSPGPRVTVTVTVEGEPSSEPSTSPSSGESPPATPPPATPPPATSPPTGAPVAGQIQNGTDTGLLDAFGALRTLTVGVDIQPGTYRTAGPVTGVDRCYWARLKSTDGDTGDVIAAGLPTGPASVTVLATDKGFQTAGCAEWTRM